MNRLIHQDWDLLPAKPSPPAPAHAASIAARRGHGWHSPHLVLRKVLGLALSLISCRILGWGHGGADK